MNVRQKSVAEVLHLIESEGKFTFSYNSESIPSDSLINCYADDWSVKEVLNHILDNKFEYKEAENYLILRYAPLRLNFIPEKVTKSDQTYHISGFVSDDLSGARLRSASVYDKKQLRSTITDKHGHFNLKIKTYNPAIALTFSKEFYRDTTIMVLSDVKVGSDENQADGGNGYNAFYRVSKARFVRFLTSSKQRMQDVNIGNFFADSPFQFSFTPGLSTQGMMSSQIVNKLSVNIMGGYTAGVEGLEIGGIFNINKKGVRYGQFAGVFNIVGESVLGIQAAGVYNVVLDSVTGSQFAGVLNELRGGLTGVQAAGVLNRTKEEVKGAQVAGVANLSHKHVQGSQGAGVINLAKSLKGTQASGVINLAGTIQGVQATGVINTAGKVQGVQVAGVMNLSAGKLKGTQVGLLNFAGKVDGTQVGLLNITDSISGYNIGLLNLARKGGYHSISVFSTELQAFNLAVKTGTSRLYTVLQGGANGGNASKLYSFSAGLGKEIQLLRKFSLHPEISHYQIYQGSWNYTNILEKANFLIHYKPVKLISVFAGPSFNVFYSNQTSAVENYSFVPNEIKTFNIGKKDLKGWFGWNIGLSFF
ncbi:hypothetical protein [Desertivirga xinjiangensis]|uniref:hypothetical protein n=1 Tax=Desertivirga xinjiangensis TaxID=539206 RepID=UPI00210C2E45|nr:hypothetical protein [Pedobacter xinjiangensis]